MVVVGKWFGSSCATWADKKRSDKSEQLIGVKTFDVLVCTQRADDAILIHRIEELMVDGVPVHGSRPSIGVHRPRERRPLDGRWLSAEGTLVPHKTIELTRLPLGDE